MKTPESLETLVDCGIIQEVVRPLMSGKEALVYVVVASGEEYVAKVYKEANQRTFKHRSEYTEGRRTRNTRDQRAMNKRSQHGRQKDEDAWRTTEVEMIYKLRDAGVRVPEPINFIDGVLVMELVKDASGQPAPRLGDLNFSAAEARDIYQQLIREVVRMLCVDVVHGDLSDFNVLMSHNGPVVIDFPQSIDPTHNPNGQKLLLRDVENLHRFLSRYAPDDRIRPYAQEIWSLYQANKLKPDTKLSGRHQAPVGTTDTHEVISLIEDAGRDEQIRREGRPSTEDDELDGPVRSVVKASAATPASSRPAPFRRVVDYSTKRNPRPTGKKPNRDGRASAPNRRQRGGTSDQSVLIADSSPASTSKSESKATGRRRRRGGRSTPVTPRDLGTRTSPTESGNLDVAKPPGGQVRRRRGRGRAESGGPARSEDSNSSNPSRPSSRRSLGARGTKPTAVSDKTKGRASADGSGDKPTTTATSAPTTDRTAARRRPTRPAKSPPASSDQRAADQVTEGERPPRRRRRRPNKASVPK